MTTTVRERVGACTDRRAFLGVAAAAAATVFVRGAAAEAASAGWVTATTLIHGLPGQAEDLRAHLLSLAGPTRAEPGCVVYDLYESPTLSHEFMRFEVWTSAEALEAHKQAPHIRASFEKRQREGWSTEIIPWSRVPG